MNWFKSLSTVWKVILLVAALVVAVLIFDAFTGKVRDLKNWMFDRKQAQIEQQNKELAEKNAVLEKQIQGYLVEIEKGKVREQAIDAELEKKGGQIVANKEATDKALDEVYKEEEITAQPTDAKTRCLRVKQKLIAQNIKSAGEIDCEKIQ